MAGTGESVPLNPGTVDSDPLGILCWRLRNCVVFICTSGTASIDVHDGPCLARSSHGLRKSVITVGYIDLKMEYK